MWRIGELARIVGVTERTLRHYDKLGLLPPAAADPLTGYRWYGVAELLRLERIRGLRGRGLSLRMIAELIDAPDEQVRQAVRDAAAVLRRQIAALAAQAEYAEAYLAESLPSTLPGRSPVSMLPEPATVGARRLRVRHHHVAHPRDLATICPEPPSTLLTWLAARPEHGFPAAVTGPDVGRTGRVASGAGGAGQGGESLTLPARTVVRAVVPPQVGLVTAGLWLFGWLARRGFTTTAGPAVEDHLVDAEGGRATVLEIPVLATHPARAAGDER
ncbi:MerR family transcriptional regulator [Solwaraspora sp. WMMB335]|uniref:MerR family transcriptional regulator n=1 Tax=Solwaraspora sp. WMMB335 TaxID=3404118 RepID=UPI003B9382F9